jgi:hypothetical protein
MPMLRRFSRLFSVLRGNQSATRSAAARRPGGFRPALEEFEARLVPSSVPLHVAGNQLADPANNPVVLRGVNIISLEWRPDGDNVMQAVNIALKDWHANLLRLPVNQDFWFGHDESWGGGESGDGGAGYRDLVDQVIASARASNAYVMLDLHWSDMGVWGANNGQHFLPDDHSTLFWQDAAPRYANDPAVLFDPYNEPHFASDQPSNSDFAKWQNGGTVTETGEFAGTYHSPGMQGLVNTIRAAGANNVLAPEGLNWGSNLSGVLNGHALSDPAGNLMYQTHLYPNKLEDPEVAASVEAVAASYPIYVGEWGSGGVVGNWDGNADASNQQMISYLDNHPNFSWTAWALTPDLGGEYNLLTEWNADSTTSDYGTYVKASLAAHANNPGNPGNPGQPAPTVVTPAAAAASPVTGTTTDLSVLGDDAAGEASLTYTWTTLNGPAGVAFSANGGNAAKNTTATFTQAGTYTFEAVIRNAAGQSTTSDVTVTVNQTLARIVINPGPAANVAVGSSQQFTAHGLDQFGNPLAVQPGFTWSVDGGAGTISDSGVYQAPAAPGSAVVRAAAGGVRGTATVTVGASLSAIASFNDVDDWGSGFTGYITLTNTGNSDLHGWTLEFDFTGNLWGGQDIWDAQIVSHVGNHYVIRNADWNSTIAAGQSVTLGFNADWGADFGWPTNFVLNGAPIAAV